MGECSIDMGLQVNNRLLFIYVRVRLAFAQCLISPSVVILSSGQMKSEISPFHWKSSSHHHMQQLIRIDRLHVAVDSFCDKVELKHQNKHL